MGTGCMTNCRDAKVISSTSTVAGLASPWMLLGSASIEHSRKEPVRFDSFRFRIFRISIGLVRFVWFDAVRPSFFGRVVARSGSVRFRVRFRPVPKWLQNAPESLWPVLIVRFGKMCPASELLKGHVSVKLSTGSEMLYGHLTIISIHYNFRIIFQKFEIILEWFISAQNYEFLVK